MPRQDKLATRSGHSKTHVLMSGPSTVRKTFPLIDNLSDSTQSNLQAKLINVLLRVVQESEPLSENIYSISYVDLCRTLEIETNNREHIRAAVKSLQQLTMTLSHFTIDGNTKKLSEAFIVLVPTVLYVDGSFTFEFNPRARPFMADTLQYAIIPETETNKLKKIGSVRLYEQCCKYLFIGRSEKMDWTILRDKMLSAKETNKYASCFSLFNAKVLAPAIDEINNCTELNIILHKYKERKKIVQLKLEVSKKAQAISGDLSPAQQQLMKLLSVLGFESDEVLGLFAKYDIESLRKAYAYTQYRVLFQKKYPIKHPNRYLLRALTNSYYTEQPDAAEMCGIVWVGDQPASSFAGLPNLSGFDVPGLDDEKRVVTTEDGIKYLNSVRESRAEEEHKKLDKEQRHPLYIEYNSTARPNAQMNLVGRRNALALTQFRRWLANRLFGPHTDEDVINAIEALKTTREGKEYLKQLRK